jgi:hypothetical protein
MGDGTVKPIEAVSSGELVLSYDIAAEQLVRSPVVATCKRGSASGAQVALIMQDGARVSTTARHPFYVRDKGWAAVDRDERADVDCLPVRPLVVGDAIMTATLGASVLTRIEHLSGSAELYNVEVQRTHVYFAAGLLAHNAQISDEEPTDEHAPLKAKAAKLKTDEKGRGGPFRPWPSAKTAVTPTIASSTSPQPRASVHSPSAPVQ